MPEVAYQKIDLGTPQSYVRAVYNAFRQHLPDAGARLLTAHSSLSTNWGRKFHNYNLAGLKASSDWRATRPYAIARGCECVEGLPNNYDPACACESGKGQQYNQTTYWRAYSSLSEGAAGMVSVLRDASRYASSWNLLLQGDTEYFAQVGRDGWYNADPSSVKAGMLKRLTQVNKYLGAAEQGVSVAALALGAFLLWTILA